MPFFAKATLDLPYADGADNERRQLEDKHAKLIYGALRKIAQAIAPKGTTMANITPDIAVQRYQDNRSLLRDALVAMLMDGAMLGADVGKAQTEAAMGVRKATPTITGVDWDLINQDVLQWVTGTSEFGGSFGQGYADTLATAMAGTSERGLRTLVGEWVRNDLSYGQLVTDLERSLFSRRRAEMVATTEITKAYAEGNRAAWQRGGIITQMQWYTVGDELVCQICQPLNGTIADVRGNFASGLFPPAHVSCRCFCQPYISDVAQQSTDQPLYAAPELQLSRVAAHVDEQIAELAPQYGVNIKEFEQTISDSFRRMVADNPVAIQFPSEHVDSLLTDGRFKTQFETGKGEGITNTTYRSNAEERGIGIPQNIADKDRPVYAFLDVGQGARAQVRDYGDLTFVFKDEVKARATVTTGDSLFNFAQREVAGTPALVPTKHSWDTSVEALYDYATGGTPGELVGQVRYIEMQIQRGASLADVRGVVDRSGLLNVAQRRALTDMGIEIWDN